MLILLVDWKKKDDFYLEKELNARGIPFVTFDIPDYSMLDRTLSYRLFILYFKYIKLAYRAVKYSKPEDILICVNYTSAVAVGYMSLVLGRKRNILALNMIAHKKFWFIEGLRRVLYRPIMKMSRFLITVNSEQYIAEYSRRFKVPSRKFYVLNDPIQPVMLKMPEITERTFVFTGGEAKRDWETLFKACKALPDISFHCIAREKYFDKRLEIPTNVELLFDTDYGTFLNKMKQASIVAIPLNSQSPAGLIVLLESASYYKPVIATRTPSTENYITDGINGYLTKAGDEGELADKIRLLWDGLEMQKTFGRELNHSVLKDHSPEKYTSNLLSILAENNLYPLPSLAVN